MDSGEFMVIVAAVLTASHDGRPSWRSAASASIFLKTDWIFGGAGTGPGRACAAFMSCLTAGESFDIAGELDGEMRDGGTERAQCGRGKGRLQLKFLSDFGTRQCIWIAAVATGAHQLTNVGKVV